MKPAFNFLKMSLLFVFVIPLNSYCQKDTVRSLANQRKKIVYLKISDKKVYRMEKIPPSRIVHGIPEISATDNGTMPPGSAAQPFFKNATDCSGNIFAGHDRAVAKTHLFTAKKATFKTINDLFSKLPIPSDASMKNHDPAIDRTPESERVNEEDKYVIIQSAFIYGIYREKDNDFHIIIGNGFRDKRMKLLNVEISGLPDDGNALKTIRQKIIGKFGNITCGDGAFKPVGALIPIKIEGSLFFDIDHAAGTVGFDIYKPKTAWEIHPVKDIQFPN